MYETQTHLVMSEVVSLIFPDRMRCAYRRASSFAAFSRSSIFASSKGCVDVPAPVGVLLFEATKPALISDLNRSDMLAVGGALEDVMATLEAAIGSCVGC